MVSVLRFFFFFKSVLDSFVTGFFVGGFSRDLFSFACFFLWFFNSFLPALMKLRVFHGFCWYFTRFFHRVFHGVRDFPQVLLFLFL